MRHCLVLIFLFLSIAGRAENYAERIYVPPVIATFDPFYAQTAQPTSREILIERQEEERAQLIEKQMAEYQALLERQSTSGDRPVVASFDPFAVALASQDRTNSGFQRERQEMRERHKKERRALRATHRAQRQALGNGTVAYAAGAPYNYVPMDFNAILNYCAQQGDPDAQAACLYRLTSPF